MLPRTDESKLITIISSENKTDEKWEEIRKKSNWLRQSRELKLQVSTSSEQKMNGSAVVNDSQQVKKRPEQDLPQGDKQTVKYRMKQNVSNEHQSRSAEIKQLSFTTPALGSQLAATNNKKKQRSTSCILRRASTVVDSYESCLVRKMFGQFREVVKTDGDEEKEEKRKEIEKIKLARYFYIYMTFVSAICFRSFFKTVDVERSRSAHNGQSL